MPDEDRENFGGFLAFEKPTYCSKSVVEKRRFRDRLVPTVVLTLEIKLRFRISPAYFGGLSFLFDWFYVLETNSSNAHAYRIFVCNLK